MKNAYEKNNLRTVVEMGIPKLNKATMKRKGVADDVRYEVWIKPHGNGRKFFCSPSHHPASYESEALLRFLLDGIDYALGDLQCGDSPSWH